MAMQVLGEQTLGKLSDSVNSYIAQGMSPRGGLVWDGVLWYQEVVDDDPDGTPYTIVTAQTIIDFDSQATAFHNQWPNALALGELAYVHDRYTQAFGNEAARGKVSVPAPVSDVILEPFTPISGMTNYPLPAVISTVPAMADPYTIEYLPHDTSVYNPDVSATYPTSSTIKLGAQGDYNVPYYFDVVLHNTDGSNLQRTYSGFAQPLSFSFPNQPAVNVGDTFKLKPAFGGALPDFGYDVRTKGVFQVKNLSANATADHTGSVGTDGITFTAVTPGEFTCTANYQVVGSNAYATGTTSFDIPVSVQVNTPPVTVHIQQIEAHAGDTIDVSQYITFSPDVFNGAMPSSVIGNDDEWIPYPPGYELLNVFSQPKPFSGSVSADGMTVVLNADVLSSIGEAIQGTLIYEIEFTAIDVNGEPVVFVPDSNTPYAFVQIIIFP